MLIFKKHLIVGFSVLTILGLASCNAYFESKKKPDNQMLSKEEQEVLGGYNPSAVVNNPNLRKNIGDIESDLQILIRVSEKITLQNARIQREEGAHGKVSRIEVAISSPYPEKMIVEVLILPKGAIRYAEYPVKVEGKVLQDNKPIGEFKTVLTGAMGGDIIPVPTETMFPMRFEVNLWDSVPQESFSTLLYTQAKLSLYEPFTDPRKIYEDNTIKPIEETEVLGNPLRITLLKEGEVK